MKIEQTSPSTVNDLWAKIKPKIEKSKTLEAAAQELVMTLHTQFRESVTLARIFLTVPFDQLPEVNKEFVQKLADSAGAGSDLKPTTPVLSLLGTHGQEKDWNDRRKSKGHMGIPLISSAFVSAIPMISRLLKELGIPLDWVDSHDSEIIKRSMGGPAGLFFVEDAGSATDNEGRKIIAAQDFVSSYKVKSVFGTGQAYPNGQILVNVLFCKDQVRRATAERFPQIVSLLKNHTDSLVENGKIFLN